MRSVASGSSSSPVDRLLGKPVASPRGNSAPRPPDAPSGQNPRHTFAWPRHCDQTLGTAWTRLASMPFSFVLFGHLVSAFEIQTDRKRMTQASHHLFGPLQVQKTARHIGIGVSFLDIALIGFQDGDFRLSPVTVLLRLRRVRSDLEPAPIDRHHRHRRRGTLRVGDDVLSHQGELFVRRDGRVTLIDPLLADLLDEPSTGLGAIFKSDSSARSRAPC